MTPTLGTARLRLRRPVPKDAGWIATQIAHPEVQRMLTTPPHPYRPEHARQWLAGPGQAEGVFVVEADRPLGIVTLCPDRNDGELGYWLRRDAWGLGIMTEAAAAVLDWHFATRDATVPSGHIMDNAASGNVLRKLGFRPTHSQMRHCNFRGQEVPIQCVALSAADWATRPRP